MKHEQINPQINERGINKIEIKKGMCLKGKLKINEMWRDLLRKSCSLFS
jgi:hypothetical protein